MKRLTSL